MIEPGEHPSLGQRSFVRCDKARLVDATILQQTLDTGVIRLSHPLSPALLARVHKAVLASPYSPNEVKRALEAPSSG